MAQAGRAGRRGKASASIYIAFDGPLDQFFMNDPARLFGRPIESAQVRGYSVRSNSYENLFALSRNLTLLPQPCLCGTLLSRLAEHHHAGVQNFSCKMIVNLLVVAGLESHKSTWTLCVGTGGPEQPVAAGAARRVRSGGGAAAAERGRSVFRTQSGACGRQPRLIR